MASAISRPGLFYLNEVEWDTLLPIKIISSAFRQSENNQPPRLIALSRLIARTVVGGS